MKARDVAGIILIAIGLLIIALKVSDMSLIISNWMDGIPVMASMQFPGYFIPVYNFVIGVIMLGLGIWLVITEGIRQKRKEDKLLKKGWD